jgi:hypothetical protein
MGGVAKWFKMLTYYVYAPLFHRFAPCPEHYLIFEIGSNVPYVLIDTDLSNLQQITVSTKNLFNTILF